MFFTKVRPKIEKIYEDFSQNNIDIYEFYSLLDKKPTLQELYQKIEDFKDFGPDEDHMNKKNDFYYDTFFIATLSAIRRRMDLSAIEVMMAFCHDKMYQMTPLNDHWIHAFDCGPEPDVLQKMFTHLHKGLPQGREMLAEYFYNALSPSTLEIFKENMVYAQQDAFFEVWQQMKQLNEDMLPYNPTEEDEEDYEEKNEMLDILKDAYEEAKEFIDYLLATHGKPLKPSLRRYMRNRMQSLKEYMKDGAKNLKKKIIFLNRPRSSGKYYVEACIIPTFTYIREYLKTESFEALLLKYNIDPEALGKAINLTVIKNQSPCILLNEIRHHFFHSYLAELIGSRKQSLSLTPRQVLAQQIQALRETLRRAGVYQNGHPTDHVLNELIGLVKGSKKPIKLVNGISIDLFKKGGPELYINIQEEHNVKAAKES